MHTNYVISLTSASTRREHIKNEFGRQNIPFEFFDALSPSIQLNETISKLLPELLKHPNQTSGEKACLMSHLLLWEKCINEDMPFITIFEDDIILGNNAFTFLNEYKWLHERFSMNEAFIIKLETFLQKVNTKNSQIKSFEKRYFNLLQSEHMGTAGYIISNRAAVLLLSEFQKLKNQQLRPIDILMFNIALNKKIISYYQLTPAICTQIQENHRDTEIIKSQLSNERRKNEQLNPYKTKHSLGQLLIKGLTKPYRLYKKKQRKIIPFE
ncbi:Beta-1,4 galactosyltransferase [Pasteurella canis]|uniref:Beta-1,4 galactosyltransferase n=1 Tax=Pasteurella canis TaxID=753 RepID=A0A379EUK7_9PAST|nr:glycosyltransferase family 25 protein [Pasteurella canis]SUC10099.1 Beta-1,4 galactosyltransferase [Pasteurella canis]